jgi:hypothetical protein
MKNEILYKITTEEVQEVALKEVGRELAADELKTVVRSINNNTAWYGIVADAIQINVRDGDNESL